MRLNCFLALASVTGAHLMESLTDIPEGWKRIGLPRPGQELHLRIAMTPPQHALFEQTLKQISNPNHSKYGQYLKRDELKDMMKPSADAVVAVTTWLTDAGVAPEAIAEDGEWITFVAPVQVANELLDTSFGIYQNLRGQNRLRTLRYSVPTSLHNYIDMIQPTTRFGEVREQRSHILDDKVNLGMAAGLSRIQNLAATNSSPCDNITITPTCLRSLYKLPQFSTIDNAKTGFMAFTNYLEEYPRYDDLDEFVQDYFPQAAGVNFTWESVNGGQLTHNSVKDSGEANLDAQYLLASGWPISLHTYSTGDRGELNPDLDQPTLSENQNEPYLDFLTYILDQDDKDLPHTITTSYGENEQSVPLTYRLKVCEMFGQLGARGVSVVFSSGDTGVGSACLTNDGKNTTRFLPIFPAACPYVTSVGGTHRVNPEIAIYFSSGGFSDTWARPEWQEDAVGRYLEQLGSRWDGLYNRSGRGFPDVAAQAYHFHVIDKGDDSLLSGTSASSPTFAGVVALLNAERIKAGKSPLGFLNPFIYSRGFRGLVDIVSGGSKGCTGIDMYSGLPTPYIPYASWNATMGWDPVTGYGTPDYEKLLPLALACGE